MSNIPVLKPQEVVRILENLGFVEVRQKGSYRLIMPHSPPNSSGAAD